MLPASGAELGAEAVSLPGPVVVFGPRPRKDRPIGSTEGLGVAVLAAATSPAGALRLSSVALPGSDTLAVWLEGLSCVGLAVWLEGISSVRLPAGCDALAAWAGALNSVALLKGSDALTVWFVGLKSVP